MRLVGSGRLPNERSPPAGGRELTRDSGLTGRPPRRDSGLTGRPLRRDSGLTGRPLTRVSGLTGRPAEERQWVDWETVEERQWVDWEIVQSSVGRLKYRTGSSTHHWNVRNKVRYILNHIACDTRDGQAAGEENQWLLHDVEVDWKSEKI